MTEKPIIRHCRNCRYIQEKQISPGVFKNLSFLYCDVRYIDITKPRIRALTCRYYEPKNPKEAQSND